MNEDFPWLLLAMVVIGFLRWVSMKLQGKNQAPDIDVRELPGEDFADEEFVREMDRRAKPAAPPAPRVDPNEELRRFFEALGGPPAVPVPPPPAAPARIPPPPPLPSQPPVRPAAPREPALSNAERAALERIRTRKAAPPRPARARAKTAGHSVRSLIASPGGLRTAVVFREILGEPRGLKEAGDPPSF